ncbi:AAA family ATPase [Streptomyces sp. NPDC090045]|uniref:AAA family ATPase n=1 Tax=Streptomyces sp. NPDC090045 TaxID=3365927 RepID=UPI0037FDC786
MEQEHGTHRIDIDGDATGPVIAGNHNVVVDAQHGSTVTLLVEREQPRPVRRDRVELLPRRQHAPLGREAELAALAAALRDGGPVQLWGPPGVGKSSILRYAARTLEPGPDGVVFLSGSHREPGDLAQDVFEACYEAAAYAPSGTELRRLMAGIRVTVYVDNAQLTEEQLRDLMDAAPDARFVFCGRERSLLGDGTALEVAGLGRAPGLALLTRALGARTPESERAALELWKAATGRPLLLLRAAALARPDASGTVALPRPGALADLLPLLLDQLDAEAMGVLRLLATLSDADVDPAHLGALTGAADPSAVCVRLTELGLSEFTERGYRCAADAVPALWDRDPAAFPVDRLCEYFARWATQRSTTPNQISDHARALEVAAELAERAGRPDLAVRVAWAASPAMARSLRFGSWGRLLDRGRIAAEHAGDRRALAYFTHEEGIRSLVTGRRVVSAVLLAEAAVLWRQLGDAQGADAAAGAQQYTPQAPEPAPADGGSTAATPDEGGTSAALPDDGGTTAAAPGDGGTTAAIPDDGGTTATVPSDGGTTATAPGDGGSTAAIPGDGGSAGHAAGHSGGWPGGDGTAVQAGGTPGGDFASHSAMPDPTAAAWSHPAASVPPPGVEHVGHLASGAGATGGVPAGAAATAGAGAAAAGGASVLTVVLAVIAVVVAVVIGGNVLAEQQAAEDVPSSPSGLAGVWLDSQGGAYRFEEKSPGAYTVTAGTICKDIVTMRFTGGLGTYRSTDEPLYDMSNSSCTRVGHMNTTLTVSSDGRSLQWTRVAPASVKEGCTSCGSISLTRVP